jgi:hypothetical protein
MACSRVASGSTSTWAPSSSLTAPMKRLRVLAWLWVTVLLGAGLGGGVVVSRVGWSLAMMMAMYGGDTEPVRPDLPYPWLGFAAAAALAFAGLGWGMLRRRPRGQGPAPSGLVIVLPLVLAYLGALAAVLLPFVQLYRLWAQLG